MQKREVLPGLILVLTLLLLVVPAVVAQEPTATPPTWVPPVINIEGQCGCDCDGINGTCVTYVIVAQNNGDPNLAPWPDASWYDVQVTDTVDNRLTIVSATSTMGTATISGQTVTVDGNIVLAPNEAFTIVITTRLTQSPIPFATVSNTAQIQYSAPPPPDGDGAQQPPISSNTDRTRIPCCPVDQIIPEVVPEASTLILLGSAATGLAGYVGMQIRARRRKRD